MKKIVLTLIIFAFFVNVSAQVSTQLIIDASGNVGIGKDPLYKLDVAGDIYIGSASNIFGTTNSNAITFKVNNVLAGFTGNSSNTNVSFGYGALPNPLAGTYNTVLGFNALSHNTTGNFNTVMGNSALSPNTTGSYNIAIGSNTGWDSPNNVANSTAIGYQATANANNSTAIGNGAYTNASNQIRIGNSSVNSIGGSANWSTISDGRAKKNIKTDVPGLDFINLLQPVTYNLDLDAMDNLLGIDKAKRDKLEREMSQDLKDISEKAKKAKEEQVQTGFVAQDVEKMAKRIGYKFSGVNVDEMGIYSLSYAEFVVPLVKAVQELSEQNGKLQETIDKLNTRIEQLEKNRK